MKKDRSGHSEQYPCAYRGANADAGTGRLPGCDLRVAGRNRRVVQNASAGCAFNGGQGVLPWMFSERMAIRDKVKRSTENCRVVLFVDDDTDGELTEKVRQAKREGLDRCFSIRLGVRKILCFGDRQRLNQTTAKRNKRKRQRQPSSVWVNSVALI